MTNSRTTNKQVSETSKTEWIDKTTFSAGVAREQGLQRGHILRGERAKTRKSKLWGDTQEVKADRQEIKLKTQQVRLVEDRTKLQIAKDDRDYAAAYQPMHRIQLTQQLVNKAYAIGANPGEIGNQVQGAIAASSTGAVNFAANSSNKTETVKVKSSKN